MANQVGQAGATRQMQALPTREFALPWVTLVAVAAVAWAITAELASDMASGSGTMGLALLSFLGLWVLMMIAMMLPSVAPVAVLWARVIRGSSAGPGRAARMGMFLGGYLLAWAACGAIAFVALTGTERLLATSPTAAKWLGVAIFIAAGLYQGTPWKDRCLRRCRPPIGALMNYVDFKGRGRDARVGLHHGLSCVGCCWGLMIVLVAVGVMNLAVMAALAAVIFAEKLWRHGESFSRAVGTVLATIGVLAIWFPALLPGLQSSGMPPM